MKKLYFVLFILLLSACDKNMQSRKIVYGERARTYNISYDKVWENTRKWCDIAGAVIIFNNESEGLINAEMAIPDSSLFKYTDYTPSLYGPKFYNCVCNIYILIKKDVSNTKVEVNIVYKGKSDKQNITLKSQNSEQIEVNRQSTGRLEKELLDFISNK